MIYGIPYFGENTNEILSNLPCEYKPIHYPSLYDVVVEFMTRKMVVVIGQQWVTWFNDIVFDYKNKNCYLPYYTYELYECKDKLYRSDDKGHLILKDNTLYIRHSFFYNKYNINTDVKLFCFDLDTRESYEVTFDKWVDVPCVDLNKLYKLYVESAFKTDDFDLNRHSGGYHYIDRQPRQFRNRELSLRQELGLPTWESGIPVENDYRDVRNYKYEEIIQLYGMLDHLDLYRERRLRFESYLYCCIKEHLLDNLVFKKGIYKYGNAIKLIIKEYWVFDKAFPNKTWYHK